MEFRFTDIASRLSDEELKDRIENRQKYLPETTEATVAELKRRGHVFSDEEITVINQDIKAQRDNAAIGGSRSLSRFNSQYKYNLVEDPQAPVLYSRLALYTFTVLFGALYGSIMMAINCIKVNNRSGMVWVLLFGVVFTTIQVIGSGYVNIGGSYYYLCGFVSGFCIDYFFWNRFIGNTTFYRAKPIWIPLIIALLIAAFVIWSTIYSATHSS